MLRRVPIEEATLEAAVAMDRESSLEQSSTDAGRSWELAELSHIASRRFAVAKEIEQLC